MGGPHNAASMKHSFEDAFRLDGTQGPCSEYNEAEPAAKRLKAEMCMDRHNLCGECQNIDFSLLQAREVIPATGTPLSCPRKHFSSFCKLCEVAQMLLSESFPSKLWSDGEAEYHWRVLPYFWTTRHAPHHLKSAAKYGVLAPVATRNHNFRSYTSLTKVMTQEFLRYIPSPGTFTSEAQPVGYGSFQRNDFCQVNDFLKFRAAISEC